MYGTASRRGLGDTLDDVAGDDGGTYAQDPQLQQLHALAVLIATLRQNFNAYLNNASNADAEFDPAVLTQIGQQLQYYVGQFNQLRATIDRTTATTYALSKADQALLDVGTWAQQVIAALPNAIATVPNALIDAVGKVATNAGRNVAQSLAIPALLVGAIAVGVIVFVKSAERTRTGRALARRI